MHLVELMPALSGRSRETANSDRGIPRLRSVRCRFVGLLLAVALAVVGLGAIPAQGISPIFADGFETGDLASWTNHSTAMVAQQQAVYAGSWAARATSTGKSAYAYEQFGTTYQELYYRVFFDLISSSTSVTLLRFRTLSGTVILNIGVNKNTELFTYNQATAKAAVGTRVAKGVWHELQVHVLVNGTSAREDVWLDGAAVASLSKVDALGTTPIGRVDLGDSGTKHTFDVAFDDVAANASFIDTHPPSVPTGLTVLSFSNQEVVLLWSASSDNVAVVGYTIYRSDDGGVSYNQIDTSTTTSYKDPSVSASTTYHYTVDAFDAAGTHSPLSAPLIVTTLAVPDTQAPTQPTGLVPTKNIAYEVDLSWNVSSDNAGVAGYTVYRSDDGGVTYSAIGTSTTTIYVDKTVSPSTAHSYTVDAFDAAGNHSTRSDPISVTTRGGFTTPIRHVVIIYQENHSFDTVLGKLCTEIASGAISGHASCDGATSGFISGGQATPLAAASDIVPSVDHSVAGQTTAIDGGKMDGFNQIGGCGATTGYACYSQFDPLSGPCGALGISTCIPNLAALAERFVISDRTFEFADTPSWGGHIVLAAPTLDGFEGGNPQQSTFTTQTGPGWGCDSFKDSRWWDGTQFVMEPSCIPDAAGNGPYRSSPVPYVSTIFDRLNAAGLSWKIYGGNGGTNGGAGWGWAICPTFYECLASSQRNNLVDASNVVTDASAGALPSYAIVTPTGTSSQHNSFSMAVGDNWIGKVVQAIENGPNWSSTAIFVTYDDCGCFYDHAPPPQAGWGIRVPMVIASPFAKAGYTDSNPATYVSMLAYTEHVFSLPPLGSTDQGAYDYANSFDYSQAPLPAVLATHTPVSAAERSYIAAHSSDEGVT